MYKKIARWTLFAILLIALFALLAACGAGAGGTMLSTPNFTSTPTLLAPYDATVQNAQANAQSTMAAGEAMSSNMAVTATALSFQSTEVSMQITMAASTQQYFAGQTATAGYEYNATQTQVAAFYQGTQTAAASQVAATQTAARVSTADAANYVATQVYLNALNRQDQQENDLAGFKTWAWRSASAALFILAFGVAILLVVVGYKNRFFLLSLIGLVRWGPNGKPYWSVPTRDGRLIFAVPDQSTGPLLEVNVNNKVGGDSKVTGVGQFELQREVNALAGMTNIVLAGNTGAPGVDGSRNPTVNAATKSAGALLSGPPQPAYVIVTNPKELPSHLHLDPEAVQQLDAQWREVIDVTPVHEPKESV